MTDQNLESHAAKRKAHKKAVAERKAETGRHLMSAREQTRQMHELKAELLTHKKAKSFVNKLFDIAMDDDHDGQMQAMKIVSDRLLPNAGFTLDSKKSTAVQINISGLQVSAVDGKDSSSTNEPVSYQ
jgi:chorismate mutase